MANIPPNISNKIGLNLHLKKDHPLNLIKTRIEDYFKTTNPPFKSFDSFSPIVTVEQNFDDLLFPKDHEGRSPSNTYYVNKNHILRPHTR